MSITIDSLLNLLKEQENIIYAAVIENNLVLEEKKLSNEKFKELEIDPNYKIKLENKKLILQINIAFNKNNYVIDFNITDNVVSVQDNLDIIYDFINEYKDIINNTLELYSKKYDLYSINNIPTMKYYLSVLETDSFSGEIRLNNEKNVTVFEQFFDGSFTMNKMGMPNDKVLNMEISIENLPQWIKDEISKEKSRQL